jgi:glycosyltransferase involved in cell wall biosynthesis
MSINVTVVIPVKNEAVNLPTCLGCLSAFAKVIVLDSGSDDDT